jgi:hypothetical protein
LNVLQGWIQLLLLLLLLLVRTPCRCCHKSCARAEDWLCRRLQSAAAETWVLWACQVAAAAAAAAAAVGPVMYLLLLMQHCSWSLATHPHHVPWHPIPQSADCQSDNQKHVSNTSDAARFNNDY